MLGTLAFCVTLYIYLWTKAQLGWVGATCIHFTPCYSAFYFLNTTGHCHTFVTFSTQILSFQYHFTLCALFCELICWWLIVRLRDWISFDINEVLTYLSIYPTICVIVLLSGAPSAGDELEFLRPNVYRNVARQLNITVASENIVSDAFLAVAADIFSTGGSFAPWTARVFTTVIRSPPLPLEVLFPLFLFSFLFLKSICPF